VFPHPPTAVTATAHKLARIVYSMLKKQEEYFDPDPEEYEAQYCQRAIKNLERKAKKLGLKVAPIEA